MSVRSRVSWTVVIVGYARGGDMGEDGRLFYEMEERDVAMRERNMISLNSMVSGYCINGDVENARLMFDLMSEKNLFT
ncbi:hypothetical protein Fmac_005557 [Flemingia macrophylla]|uniref:Pentatricopeptide repeat-containing protein n=1 Tax=Flemingia macrophylla TaxID=520843 RepID=A0ABD1N845_9FABA